VRGLGGGIYQGLPMFSYLTGKNDFAGFGSLQPYEDLFLEYMKQRDYASISRLFSVLNINQIFYNSDPLVYTNVLKDYLYAHVSKYAPKDQDSYKSFIESLPIDTRVDFGDKYHIYTIKSNTFLPHIFSTTDIVYTNDQISFAVDPYINNNAKTVPVSIDTEIKINKDNSILFGIPQTFLFELSQNSHFHKHKPIIRHRLDSIFYQFVSLKEKVDLYRARNDPNDYFDLSLLLLSKRIVEIETFHGNMPIIKKSWKEPGIWEIYRLYSYNSWEASLTRYEKGVEEVINWVVNSNNLPDIYKDAGRVKINEQLLQHQTTMTRIIKKMHLANSEKRYIFSLTNELFDRLLRKVKIPIYNTSEYYYDLPEYSGNYNVYLERRNTKNDLTSASISINNETLKPFRDSFGNVPSTNFLQFDNYSSKHDSDIKLTLHMPANNLIKNVEWDNSGNVLEVNKLLAITANNDIGENTSGLVLDIPDWIEKNIYIISFDYLTNADDFIFSFYDEKESSDNFNKRGYKLFFEKILNSETWKAHQSIVAAEAGSSKGFIRISAFSQKDVIKMYIKNLSVVKIEYPTVIFKKIAGSLAEENKQPKITFTKINPTKYSVQVSGSENPYGLVFLESFNNNWTLIDPSKEEKTIMGSIFRGVGCLGKNAISPFMEDGMRQKGLSASYFNGEVKENPYKNIFLGPSTFETWGKTDVAQSTHSEVFGYANAWFIDPEDMQGRSEYTLIIEMKNQKQFYIFGFLSLATLFSIIIFYIKRAFLSRGGDNS